MRSPRSVYMVGEGSIAVFFVELIEKLFDFGGGVHDAVALLVGRGDVDVASGFVEVTFDFADNIASDIAVEVLLDFGVVCHCSG